MNTKNVSLSMIFLLIGVAPLCSQDKRFQEDKDDAFEELMSGNLTLRFYNALGGKEIAHATEEIEKYLMENIPDKAREQNREQTPQVVGDKNRVLVKY